MCNILAFSFDVRTDTQAQWWWEEANKRALRFKCTASFEASVWAPLEEGQSWVSELCFVFLGLSFFHSKYVCCSFPAFYLSLSLWFLSPLRLMLHTWQLCQWCCPAELPKMCSWLPLFSCLSLPILYLHTPNTKDLNCSNMRFFCHPNCLTGIFCRLPINLANLQNVVSAVFQRD